MAQSKPRKAVRMRALPSPRSGPKGDNVPASMLRCERKAKGLSVSGKAFCSAPMAQSKPREAVHMRALSSPLDGAGDGVAGKQLALGVLTGNAVHVETVQLLEQLDRIFGGGVVIAGDVAVIIL